MQYYLLKEASGPLATVKFLPGLNETRGPILLGGTIMLINTLSGECGAGKTYQILQDIRQQRGQWIYAVDRIDLMNERQQELNFNGEVIHIHRIGNSKHIRRQLKETQIHENMVIFVTHEALFSNDWTKFKGFNLVIDESKEIFAADLIDWHNDFESIKESFISVADDNFDNHYILALSAKGKEKLVNKIDDLLMPYFNLLEIANKPNIKLLVSKEEWDTPVKTNLEWISLIAPEFLAPFNQVWMIADELPHSPIYKIWCQYYGIEFNEIPIRQPRCRKIPLNKRVIIRYFSRKSASFFRFDQSDLPLVKMARYINSVDYWSTNAAYLSDINGYMTGTYLSPRQTGRNDLQWATCVAWLSVMNPTPVMHHKIKELTDIDWAQYREWISFNPMYQFVMRSALRDYESDKPVIIYVFDKYQAEYLIKRFSGGNIQHITDIVSDKTLPLSSTERSRKSRAKRN